jgi:hypothetical protein
LRAAVSAIPAASDEPEAFGIPAESPKARSRLSRPALYHRRSLWANGRAEQFLNNEAERLVKRRFCNCGRSGS